jgi:MoxR-like ATPase
MFELYCLILDLRGLPFLGADNRSKWATPDFLPQDGEGILSLDELNAAPAMVQASCYQLVLDRKLGEYTLPDGWAIVAAGNRDSDRGATTRMPTPLRNRFVHLDFEVTQGTYYLCNAYNNSFRS